MHIIGGEFRKRKIATPSGDTTRPTSGRLREAVFNICQLDIEGASFLDICAGSGAMGLEALSRGASFATFIDSHPQAIRAIAENIKNFKIEKQTKVLSKEALLALKQLQTENFTYNICYIDPPYHQKELLISIISFLDQSSHFLAKDATIFVEDAANSLIDGLVLSQLTLASKRKVGDSILYVFKT